VGKDVEGKKAQLPRWQALARMVKEKLEKLLQVAA